MQQRRDRHTDCIDLFQEFAIITKELESISCPQLLQASLVDINHTDHFNIRKFRIDPGMVMSDIAYTDNAHSNWMSILHS
jgi:hypothetical protein